MLVIICLHLTYGDSAKQMDRICILQDIQTSNCSNLERCTSNDTYSRRHVVRKLRAPYNIEVRKAHIFIVLSHDVHLHQAYHNISFNPNSHAELYLHANYASGKPIDIYFALLLPFTPTVDTITNRDTKTFVDKYSTCYAIVVCVLLGLIWIWTPGI